MKYSEPLTITYKENLKKMNEEIWKQIPSFPNYEASNLGNIRRAKNGKIIKSSTQDIRGYHQVSIYFEKRRYTKAVSRLIWEAFKGCPCKKTIDHKDRDKKNNNIENLSCVSLKKNIKNRSIYRGKNKYNLTKEIKIKIIQGLRSKELTTWSVAKIYGIPPNYIQTVMKRGTWDKLLWKKNDITNSNQ